MAMADRSASTVWEGNLPKGKGTLNLDSSHATGELPVSWASRSEKRAEGQTSPEELIAAAHASCFSMALSNGLAQAGSPPEELDVSATVTFVPGTGITKSALEVTGRVPGMDEDAFREAAEAAKDGCPVSGALKGNVELELNARLA
jgi:lipoyl-dependent peroxiredoxin